MSADNWAECPRCEANREATAERLHEAARAAYGVEPVEAYMAKLGAAQAEDARKLGSTLREDYEIYGADSGVVKVRYSCCCEVCGLGHGFKHESAIPGLPA